MLKNFCHDQVKLLLERMESHPEEFFTPKTLGNGKWDPFMPGSSMFRHFTKLEQYLIRRKYCKVRDKIYRQQAYDSILETLVFKEEKPEYITFPAPPHLGTPSVNDNTHKKQLALLRAQMQTMREELGN